MQRGSWLVRWAKVRVHARLRLSWMGHWEVNRDLGLGPYLEMPARGSMAMLMPVKLRSCKNNDTTSTNVGQRDAGFKINIQLLLTTSPKLPKRLCRFEERRVIFECFVHIHWLVILPGHLGGSQQQRAVSFWFSRSLLTSQQLTLQRQMRASLLLFTDYSKQLAEPLRGSSLATPAVSKTLENLWALAQMKDSLRGLYSCPGKACRKIPQQKKILIT